MSGQLDQVARDVPGWSPSDQLLALYTLSLATATLPGKVIEVGAWCGRSAIALGLAARASGTGPVHSIDLFPAKEDWVKNADGSYSLSVALSHGRIEAYTTQTVWSEPFARDIAPIYDIYPDTLAAFRSAVASHDLEAFIIPHKGTLSSFLSSDEFRDLRVRLAFIDGDHGHDAVVDDIERIEKHLVPGGWLCFDDAFTTYSGVDSAIEEKVLRSGRYRDFQQITRKMFVARRAGS